MLSSTQRKQRGRIRIQLIQPPLWAYNLPPLGIAYLAGALRNAGMQVRVQELNRGFFLRMPDDIIYLYRQMDTGNLGLAGAYPHWSFIFDRVSAFPAEKQVRLKKILEKKLRSWTKRIAKWGGYVCFSVHNTSLAFAKMLAQEIRKVNPRQVIIFGGPEIDSHHYDLLKQKAVDYFVQGEGEEVLINLLLELEEKKAPTPYRGLTFYQQETLIEGHGNTGQSNINQIPFPDFSDFFFYDYNYHAAIPILSSRSCVARCTFCAEPSYWGAFRQREPENILTEMEYQFKKYRIKIFYFCDSLINGSVPWLVRLADQLLASSRKFYWGGNSRISYRMDTEVLQKLHQSGLRFLYFGIESGSQDVLNKMKKGVLKKTMRQVLKDTHQTGIWVHTYWILGFPEETDLNAVETAEFILEEAESIDSFNFSNFFPKDDLKAWPDYVKARDHHFGHFAFWDDFYKALMPYYFETINNYFELKYWLMNREQKLNRLEETPSKQRNRNRVKTIFALFRTLHQYFVQHQLRILRETVPPEVAGENVVLWGTRPEIVPEMVEQLILHKPKQVFLALFPKKLKDAEVVAIKKLIQQEISIVFPGPVPQAFQEHFGERDSCEFCFHLFFAESEKLGHAMRHIEQQVWEIDPLVRQNLFWNSEVYQKLVQHLCPYASHQSPLLFSASSAYNNETSVHSCVTEPLA